MAFFVTEGAEDFRSTVEEGVADLNELADRIFEQEVGMMTEAVRNEYLQSDEVKAVVEAGVVNKRTIVRLSKMDDLSRRIKIASLMKAKEKGDADWEALRKNRIIERKLLGRIMGRYANQVKRDAVVAQRNLLKITPNAFNRPIAMR